MTIIPVDREVLDRLLQKAWTMFELLAEESGYTQMTLEPESELVTVAVVGRPPYPGTTGTRHRSSSSAALLGHADSTDLSCGRRSAEVCRLWQGCLRYRPGG